MQLVKIIKNISKTTIDFKTLYVLPTKNLAIIQHYDKVTNLIFIFVFKNNFNWCAVKIKSTAKVVFNITYI